MPAKRNRGNRKRSTPARAARVSPRRLLDQAREALAREDGRTALDLINRARDRDHRLAGLPLVSFCARVQRARQLAAKGMDREAAAMRARAEEQRASLSTQALSEGDWAQYVRYLDGADAVAAYADHLSTAPPMPAVERALADQLVIERGWADLDVLDADRPLRRHAAVGDAGAHRPQGRPSGIAARRNGVGSERAARPTGGRPRHGLRRPHDGESRGRSRQSRRLLLRPRAAARTRRREAAAPGRPAGHGGPVSRRSDPLAGAGHPRLFEERLPPVPRAKRRRR